MFVISIDIWPHGDWHRPWRKAMIAVANDGTGTQERGNYQAILVPQHLYDEPQGVWLALKNAIDSGQTAKVKHFPRGHSQAHLPALTVAVIDALGLGEVAVEAEAA